MKTYYAFKNKNNQHKQDPDYFVFLPKSRESNKRKTAGKIYKNKSSKGTQYLTIYIFEDNENNKDNNSEKTSLKQFETKGLLNLDEINDPHEKSKEKWFVFEITKAEHFTHKKLNGAAYITLELQLVEECRSAIEQNNAENFQFKVDKIHQSLNLDSGKIWLLKNLCNALHIAGNHNLEDLSKLFIKKRVKAKIIARYNKKINGYYYVVREFKEVTN